MARATGSISDPSGYGGTAGWVGDLPIDEAIEAVLGGRVRLDVEQRESGDVSVLLAGLGVESMGELAQRLDREQALQDALTLARPYIATPKKRGDWREEERRKAVLSSIDEALA